MKIDLIILQRCGSKINTSSSGIIEIGHNLRWIAQDCQWTITAENPSTFFLFFFFQYEIQCFSIIQ